MIRLYRREHESSKSKYFGVVWLCPDNHTLITDIEDIFTLTIERASELLREHFA